MAGNQPKKWFILLIRLVASCYNLKLIYFLVYFEENKLLRKTSYGWVIFSSYKIKKKTAFAVKFQSHPSRLKCNDLETHLINK